MRDEPETSTLREAVAKALTDDVDAVRRSFVVTHETGEICARIFQRLCEFPAAQAGGFLFSGERGVGKTHLLGFVAALFADPRTPEWEALERYLAPGTRRTTPLASRFIRLPADPAVDLAGVLASALELTDPSARETGARSQTIPPRLAEAAARWAGQSIALVVLDDISRRLERLGNVERIERELGQIRRVTGAFAAAGILVVLVVDGTPIGGRRDRATEAAVTALSGVCDFLWISRNNLLDVIAALAPAADGRPAASDVAIDAVAGARDPRGGGLGETGGDAAPNDTRLEGLRSVHPFHPQVYNALFQLRRIVPAFSPLEFARAALACAETLPAGEAIGLDFLFDQLQPKLREVSSLAPLLAAFDELRSIVVVRLKPAIQVRAETLLKAIALLTICPTEPATARALTDGLPPFEAPGLSSYTLTSTILTELELEGGRYLLVEGERLDRTYRLLEPGSEVEYLRAERSPDGDLCPLEFPRLVSDWIHGQVPGWATDASSRYLRLSQSLAAPLPSGAEGPRGVVYFKSVYDPLWSDADLAALREMQAAWVVLVLSPFERYYELDALLRDLTLKSDRLLVWRPDSPLPAEARRLRIAARVLHDRDTHGSTVTTAERLVWSNAQYLAEEVLGSLYLGRGRLLGGGRERRVAEGMGSLSLGDYLTACLRELTNPQGMPADMSNGPAGQQARSDAAAVEQARTWGALLAHTPPELATAELEAAVLAEWDTIESHGLRQELDALTDSFLTSEFSKQVRAWEGWFETLLPLFARLRARDLPFVEAMSHVARGFGGDTARFLAGKELHANLAALVEWAPQLERARDYLAGALPTRQEELEQLREDLLEGTTQPHTLLAPSARDRFDQAFLQYRRRYIDLYHAMHEEALNIVGSAASAGGREAPVDYVALRNLELLSRLQYTDKSYLNRVRIIGKWVQTNQCALPVRQILERYPRCYCNFNPSGSKLTDSVARLNRIIEEGTDYFRAILRRCNIQIIHELQAMHVDDFHSRQIAALLSRGPMIPLNPQSVDILNRFVQSHAADFVAAIRAHKTRV